jgi:N-acylneuraminate cytidylyltransferase
MGLVGWPVAVADAHPAVRQAARLVLARSGGHGAVRELCDLVVAHRQETLRANIADGGVRGSWMLERL